MSEFFCVCVYACLSVCVCVYVCMRVSESVCGGVGGNVRESECVCVCVVRVCVCTHTRVCT